MRGNAAVMALAGGALAIGALGCSGALDAKDLATQLGNGGGLDVRDELPPQAAPPMIQAAAPGPVQLDPFARVGEPGPTGTWGFGPTSTPQELSALEWINLYRDRAGLPWLLFDDALAAASRGHAEFLAANWELYDGTEGKASLHKQIPGNPGFTGESFWERMEDAGFSGKPLGEVIAQTALPSVAVTQWIESLYHRIPLLHPDADRLGFGTVLLPDETMGVAVGLLARRATDSEGLAVAYPPHGATDVPTSWSGAEVPQPPAPPGGYPSGPLFTLIFRGKGEIVVTAHALLEGGDTPVPHTQLDPKSDPHLAATPAIALYAHAPLRPLTTYKVQLKGLYAGQPFSWQSWFRTIGDTQCDPLRPTCSETAACFFDGATPVCSWPGPASVGEACTHSNDCPGGASCVEGVCRALCRTDSLDEESCELRCPGGWSSYYGLAGWGACHAPGCSPLASHSCGGTSRCLVDTAFRCGEAGLRPWGAMCDTAADCWENSACARIGDSKLARCLPLCDARPLAGMLTTASGMFTCAEFCPDEAVAHPSLPSLGVCTTPAP